MPTRVPTANVTTNKDMRDVVGNKSDAAVTTVGTVATLVAYLKGLLNLVLGLGQPAVATGETAIDDSVQDESAAWFPLLTIAPATGAPLTGVRLVVDMAKTTTGYAAGETSATIQFRIARKVDGTNWRGGDPTTALSGTNAAGRSIEIDVRNVGVTEQARLEAKMSADATQDVVLPYALYYMAKSAPTITPVVAG